MSANFESITLQGAGYRNGIRYRLHSKIIDTTHYNYDCGVCIMDIALFGDIIFFVT